jgi:hypothetical protein
MIFFDAEERKRIGKKRRMALISWYDEEFEEMKTVLEPELDLFVSAATDTELLVGFNIFAFDFKLFENTDFPVTEARDKTLDLFRFLFDRVQEGEKGLTLNALGICNLGMEKIKLEKNPSWLFEAGYIEIVEDYNRRDVQILRSLYYKALEEEMLLYEPDIPEEELEEGMGQPIDCSELESLSYYLKDNFYSNLVGW